MSAPLDLSAVTAEFLQQCPACDIAMPEHGCNCPQRDYRSTMLDLVREVERLRTEVATLTIERDNARRDSDVLTRTLADQETLAALARADAGGAR